MPNRADTDISINDCSIHRATEQGKPDYGLLYKYYLLSSLITEFCCNDSNPDYDGMDYMARRNELI